MSPQHVNDSPDSSDAESSKTPPPKRKPRANREATPVPTPPPRSRRPSGKQALNDKENLERMKAQIAALEKKLKKDASKASKSKSQNQAPTRTLGDGDVESEEPMSGADDGPDSDDSATFPSANAIKPLGNIPLPSQKPKPVTLRKTKRSTEPRTAAPNPFLASHFLSSASQFLSSTSQFLSSASQFLSSASQFLSADSKVVSHASQLFCATIALILARSHRLFLWTKQTAEFFSATIALILACSHCFFLWTKQTTEFSHSTSAAAEALEGIMPTSPHALILRACAEYSARILARNPYPDVPMQIMSAKECFKSACRATKERYILTDRMEKIIRARGSQKRGKMVEIFRALCPSHFGFVRSTARKQIDANRLKAKALLEQASFHYKFKDPVSRTGFGENKIIAAARQAMTFKDKDSSGVLFPSYFNPYPISALAFELATLEFVIREWSTGSFIQAKFTEKDVAKVYKVHLADTQTWNACNEAVTENIRRKWYRRASETFITDTPEAALSSNIDSVQADALRAELLGRTGDTESEPEDEGMTVDA
ncbi:hypothetical protein MSAN_01502500 [Mycena sanguinolenta]|uniref:DUF6532 domain-containing protein n=1 Tax=Mycena sanguinolenta TaxID=230812 RepID=A0A8H6Y7R4_9AGAR|nr:hypothetical protein MSAN_01502500 [Mycena sanguinolenta]